MGRITMRIILWIEHRTNPLHILCWLQRCWMMRLYDWIWFAIFFGKDKEKE